MKNDFLDYLSATCDVKASARSIGVDPHSVYYLRRRDEPFSAEWERALALGYQMLETQLVGHLMDWDGTNEISTNLPGKPGKIDVDHALRMLSVHRNAMQGNSRAPKGRTKFRHVSQEETDAALLASIAKTERKLGLRRGGSDAVTEIGDGGEPA